MDIPNSFISQSNKYVALADTESLVSLVPSQWVYQHNRFNSDYKQFDPVPSKFLNNKTYYIDSSLKNFKRDTDTYNQYGIFDYYNSENGTESNLEGYLKKMKYI